MSNTDYYLAELFAEHLDDADSVGALRDAISLLVRTADGATPRHLAAVLDGHLSEGQCRNAVLALENASILTGDGRTLDRERLTRVTHTAQLLTERTPPPDNELVATIPEGEASIEERHFGPLLLRLRELVGEAEDDIFLVTPFFSDEIADRLVNPLAAAADRGVDITITTRYLTYGDKTYNRDFVRELFDREAIREQTDLYEYVRDVNDLGGTVHAKLLVVDRQGCYLGTANLTHRGLRDNLELGIILRDETVAKLRDLADSLRRSSFMHRVLYGDGTFDPA